MNQVHAPDMQDLLRQLSLDFANQLPHKLQEIAGLLQHRVENAYGQAVFKLYRLVHSLTGSGATFGMPQVSNFARALELQLRGLSESDKPADAALWQAIETDFEALRQAAETAIAQLVQRGTASVAESMGEAVAGSNETPYDSNALPSRKVVLIEDDESLVATLSTQLGLYGYQVVRAHSAADVNRLLQEERPLAILVDIMLPHDINGGFKLMQGIETQLRQDVPMIFMSARHDLQARLEAVRCGADAFFVKPLDVTHLTDLLESYLADKQQEACRVLVIEDSQVQAVLYAETLRQAGMQIETLTDPIQLESVLNRFMPELILMDMYMPGCTGDELARVIRQQEAFVSVPIVFLSAERDLGRQLLAMTAGGDDFLTKPIEAEHLILAVRNRVKRYRVLRNLMERDSLTGLLHHTKSKEKLDIELARAQRNQHPLSLAMIDLDLFKQVNDRYGHPVGDRVIKSLVQLLRQRLRVTDIIGRYGGEEFLVVFTDTSAIAAAKVLNQIRMSFARVVQYAGDMTEFSVSFSAGIAEYPVNGIGSTDLIQAADDALYQAKAKGRNRIVISDRESEGVVR